MSTGQHPAAPSAPPSVAGDAGESEYRYHGPADLEAWTARIIRRLEATDTNDTDCLDAANLIRRLATAEQPVHPDDAAVDRFAAAMKAKLAKKRAEGRGGWNDPEQCTVEFLSELLHRHVRKGDPVDVGNIAMMLHQRGSGIHPEQPGSAVQGDRAKVLEMFLGRIFAAQQLNESREYKGWKISGRGSLNEVVAEAREYLNCPLGAVDMQPPAPDAEPFVDGNGVIRSGILPDAPAAEQTQPEARGVEGSCEDPRLKAAGYYVCGSNGDREWHFRRPDGTWQDRFRSEEAAVNAALREIAAAPSGVRVDARMIEVATNAYCKAWCESVQRARGWFADFDDVDRHHAREGVIAALTAALSENEVSRG